LDVGWRDYRGWAAVAGSLQRSYRQQAAWALSITCAAALFGALASINWPDNGSILIGTSTAAAVLGVFGSVLGRYILDANAQQQWIQARATAEAIKSECYRYAAHCGEYRNKDAAERFRDRVESLSASATSKGLVLDAGARAAAKGGPSIDMNVDWYRINRLADQRKYYETRSGEHAKTAARLRFAGLGFGLAAGALGAISAAHIVSWVAPFVGMMTTISASVAAYGALSRQVYLAASYSGMASQIDKLMALHDEGIIADDKLVEAGEDLLTSEHRAWADRVAQQEPQRRQVAPSRATRAAAKS